MRAPTPLDPVKLTMSTSGDATSASPLSGVEPVTTLTTPGGKPTSSSSATSLMIASGSCPAGRTTTVLPVASAGRDLADHVDDREVVRRDARDHARPAAGAPARRSDHRAPAASPAISCGAQRDHRRLERTTGVALEADRGLRNLHRLADRRGAPGLRDHEWDELVATGQQRGARGLEQLGALLGRGPRPRRERILAPLPAASWACAADASGALPTTSSVAGLTIG